jgi:hypothetical protein
MLRLNLEITAVINNALQGLNAVTTAANNNYTITYP